MQGISGLRGRETMAGGSPSRWCFQETEIRHLKGKRMTEHWTRTPASSPTYVVYLVCSYSLISLRPFLSVHVRNGRAPFGSFYLTDLLSRSFLTRGLYFSVQDRAKRLKLLNFMADKAELLYKPLDKDELPQPTNTINDEEGVMAGGWICPVGLLSSQSSTVDGTDVLRSLWKVSWVVVWWGSFRNCASVFAIGYARV